MLYLLRLLSTLFLTMSILLSRFLSITARKDALLAAKDEKIADLSDKLAAAMANDAAQEEAVATAQADADAARAAAAVSAAEAEASKTKAAELQGLVDADVQEDAEFGDALTAEESKLDAQEAAI